MNDQPIPQELAPTLILSKKSKPFPPAFQIQAEIWCVSAEVRELMQRLYGSQVAFYEVPAVVKAGKKPLPPTYFVTFSQYRRSIDWSRSKTKMYTVTYQDKSYERVSIVDVPGALVFEAAPKDRAMIWIETLVRIEGRLHSPPAVNQAYTTNDAARAMAEAFPDIFNLREFEEGPASP